MTENGKRYTVVIVDDPAPGVRRITMNRPEKRNALFHTLRGEILGALREADQDDSVKVSIIRGAGKCFSAGYDLGGGNEGLDLPFFTAGGDGQWPRHVTEGWMSIWDLAKPVIAQVHGYCLAGGSELASGCDLIYVAEDAQIGYPAVRFGVPDMHFHAWTMGMRKAMEAMLTGDSMSGTEAVEYGWANAAFPVDELDEKVLAVASKIAKVPADVVQINKRVVHRQMEVMGLRTGIRIGTELCALGTHQKTLRTFVSEMQKGLTDALTKRDAPFGDYRTADNQPSQPGHGGA
ncbi:MAG TPA: enoyl-CoA hydratase-related protein [Acidimicrobiales bacterium]|nr:enoyl-CoA hydratase-related protein [Acidimicrobiales bacterium]